MLNDIKKDAQTRMAKSIDALKHTLTSIRTGRATPALLDRVTVSAYGNASTPLNQVASISNADAHSLLDLCFALLDGAQVMPYYFYMCDMIPFSEHWRVSVADAQRLQHHIMGYLPGFATPRIVCDVPFVGKRGNSLRIGRPFPIQRKSQWSIASTS